MHILLFPFQEPVVFLQIYSKMNDGAGDELGDEAVARPPASQVS